MKLYGILYGISIPEYSEEDFDRWVKKYGPDSADYKIQSVQQSEINRLKKELRRVTEERDILRKAAVYFAKESQ